MITDELLRILICPDNGSRLTRGEQGLVDRLNQAITAKRLKNKAGRSLEAPLSGVLVREDQTVVYPIVDDIPLMLADEAIPLAQLE